MFLTEEDKQGKSQANDERYLFLFLEPLKSHVVL